MAKASKKKEVTHGGARQGAGRKPKDPEDKKITEHVYITPDRKAKLIKKYGSLTKAIETVPTE